MAVSAGDALCERSGVLIADSCPVFRLGLSQLLDQQAHLYCCGQFDNFAELKCALASARPQILSLDLMLRDGEGLEFIRTLKAEYPEVKILVISHLDEVIYAERVLRAGALGYLPKQQNLPEIVLAFETVRAGEIYITRRMAVLLACRMFRAAQCSLSALEHLTNRELQIFHLIGAGLSSKKIASNLSISLKTVEAHRWHIRHKLGLSCSKEMVRHAIRFVQGDVELP